MEMSARRRVFFEALLIPEGIFTDIYMEICNADLFPVDRPIGRPTDRSRPPAISQTLPGVLARAPSAIFAKLPGTTPGSFSLPDVDLFDEGKK